MYKVSITTLEGFKEALENANKVLDNFREIHDTPWINSAIKKNDEQIRILAEHYYIGEKTNSNE